MCATGEYTNNNTSCSACEAGSYCTNGIKYACEAGTYSAASATSCSTCEAGSYCQGGLKQACAADKYSTPGSTQCKSCIPGKIPNSGQSGCVDKCSITEYYNTQTDECETKCTGRKKYDYATNTCVEKCSEGQIWNATIDECDPIPEIPLKNYSVFDMQATENYFKMDLIRDNERYPYHLIMEINRDANGNKEVRRYCTGDESCKIISQGKDCTEGGWEDWCYYKGSEPVKVCQPQPNGSEWCYFQ